MKARGRGAELMRRAPNHGSQGISAMHVSQGRPSVAPSCAPASIPCSPPLLGRRLSTISGGEGTGLACSSGAACAPAPREMVSLLRAPAPLKGQRVRTSRELPFNRLSPLPTLRRPQAAHSACAAATAVGRPAAVVATATATTVRHVGAASAHVASLFSSSSSSSSSGPCGRWWRQAQAQRGAIRVPWPHSPRRGGSCGCSSGAAGG